jgi:YHS domain-containing protein
MVRLTTGVAVLALAIGLVGPAAAKSHTAAPKCTSCGMKLSTKKSAATPVAMKVNGKTYYCCDKCSMGKKTATAAAAPKCSTCGMKLSTKKTAEMTQAVKVNGKTYYCCSACTMKKS